MNSLKGSRRSSFDFESRLGDSAKNGLSSVSKFGSLTRQTSPSHSLIERQVLNLKRNSLGSKLHGNIVGKFMLNKLKPKLKNKVVYTK